MNLKAELEKRLSAALATAGAPAGSPALVGRSARPELGDYQANGIMAAAKALKSKPRQLAEKVLAAADLSDIADKLEIAGPGFINIRLKPQWLAGQLSRIAADEHLGVDQPSPDQQQTVVVDYSGPNLAKEMHVGHLRSTIIGDALARTLEFTGQEVIRQNHVGDWGTQFGLVILGMWHICMARYRNDPSYITTWFSHLKLFSSKSSKEKKEAFLKPLVDQQDSDVKQDWDGEKIFHPFVKDMVKGRTVSLLQLEEAYQFVSKIEELAEDTDIEVETSPNYKKVHLSKLSRWVTSQYIQRPTELPNEQEWEAWKYACELTIESCQEMYKRLSIQLTESDICGESFYAGMDIEEPRKYDERHDFLPKVLELLDTQRILTPSKGAQCVFLPEFKDKNNLPLPLIVRKSDEGYLYATTDLAAIRYRVGVLHANRVLYVTDSRQALHFRQVFAVARKAGFAPADVSLEHIAFGTMMGPDGKPFKTREGGTVKLMDLLDEAEKRALALVKDKNPDLPEDQKEVIAHIVGIGAVKYADLSQNRTSDYVFSWDRMLCLEGNTAPYMQYAYARIRSIFRKGPASLRSAEASGSNQDEIIIHDPAERELAIRLVQFPEIVAVVAADCTPNVLCAYLYELAGAFMVFYENCPVLQSDQTTRASRLRLCELTARTIRRGLGLLGIETIDQM